MKFFSALRYAAGLIFMCAALVAARAGSGITDDRGTVVQLAAVPQRIVTLAPHLAELAYAAGAGKKLVGVARFSDYPAAVQGLPQVGDAARIDFERVLALKPDLVLAWESGNPALDVARLERLGIPVFVTEPARLADIPRIVRAIGALAGTAGTADAVAAGWADKLRRLREKYAGRPPVRVFYEVWHRPLLTVNGAHFISDVIALCGGVNVFAGVQVLTPAVSLEAVLAARPDLIIGGSAGMSAGEFAAQWQSAPVAALRRIPVLFVAPDTIQRPGLRLLDGAKSICAGLERVRGQRNQNQVH